MTAEALTDAEFRTRVLAQLAEVTRLLNAPDSNPTIMQRKQAIAYVGKNSPAAFDRWVRRCAPGAAVAFGRYSRARLDIGLAREAGRVAK